MVEKEYKKLLRSYRTLWQKAKRDRERLLKIKGLTRKINQILSQIHSYDGGNSQKSHTLKQQAQRTKKKNQN